MSRSTGRRRLLAALAFVPLFTTGCACLYGGCGSRSTTYKWDGQTCATLRSTETTYYRLGANGDKLHGFGGSPRFYAGCFYFTGRKGATYQFTVQSDEFQPEIMLIRRGDDDPLGHDQGSSSAQIEVTLNKNGDYALVVTSVSPRETGQYDVNYASE